MEGQSRRIVATDNCRSELFYGNASWHFFGQRVVFMLAVCGSGDPEYQGVAVGVAEQGAKSDCRWSCWLQSVAISTQLERCNVFEVLPKEQMQMNSTMIRMQISPWNWIPPPGPPVYRRSCGTGTPVLTLVQPSRFATADKSPSNP